MKLIKIINGTYGFRPQPHVVELKTADDAPFEVDDKEAARLVELGVAAIAFGEDSESLQEAMDEVVDQLGDQPTPPDDEPEDDEPEDPAADPDPDDGEPEDDEPEDPAADPDPDDGEPEDEVTEEPAAKFDPEELEKLTNPQLGELAEELGVHLPGRPKKSEFIAAIMKAAEEDDELPDLGAVDPEV